MKWALITGSSVGIGRELAIQLSNKGYAIILHGRNEDDLNKTKSLLKTKSMIITKDLADQDASEYIIKRTKDLNIKCLINNAGFSVSGDYIASDIEEELAMIKTHITFPMQIIKELSDRLENGFILNVASLYSFFAVPKQSIYGASKAFTQSYSLALHHEMKKRNIGVTTLSPGLTYSHFRTRHGKEEKKYPFIGLEADIVAKCALDGMFSRKIIVVPGVFSKCMAMIIPLLPYNLQLLIIDKMNSSRGY